MLHIWGWVGVGERLLGLPPSGNLLHPPPQASANGVRGAEVKDSHALTVSGSNGSAKGTNGNGVHLAPLEPPLSAPNSGRASPTHPLAGRRTTTILSNLIKSALVFGFSALHHDYSSILMMLDAIGDGRAASLEPSMALSLTPFFCCQPIGIAIEAAVKRVWRSQRKHFSSPWISTFECAIGFVWTWVWLGWTARFFVQGMARLGVWVRYPDHVHFTAFGWVWE